jgi:mRNA-degrading endonuclease RelE of RelBE toxin-antitoxin system
VDEFHVLLSPSATKDLDRFSDGVCKKILKALQALKVNPFPRGKLIKKIKGTNSDYYRLRVDAYRVFYIIEGTRAVVMRILDKKDVQRFIRNLS